LHENVAATIYCASSQQRLVRQEVTHFLRSGTTEDLSPHLYHPNQTPEPPLAPVELPTTEADQTRTNVDLSNQMTVDEMGQLLGSIYQCAYQNRGPLLERFGDRYNARECKQMLHVMSNNTVDALLKAGVPEGTRVAHKHGWIDDTHGNAAVFFTPGGDYVIVMMLYQPTWLNFQSPLVIAESRGRSISLQPDAPMEAIWMGLFPKRVCCNFAGSLLIDDLISARSISSVHTNSVCSVSDTACIHILAPIGPVAPGDGGARPPNR
jgi:hypothetical protein